MNEAIYQMADSGGSIRIVVQKKTDEFYREYVRDHYLADLGTMSERMVLLWF